ncbi:hypothetical protein [Streptomyces sp. NPDC047123]|uniref:hypothetical protein n=1 Tax=Streptomyces sp. NPDC047123 TaxID=3155622 RepID=UPI0033D2CED0
MEAKGLADLARQVDEDRAALAQIMSDVDVPISRSKVAMGWLAEKAGRLKPNGQVLSRSPLGDLLETEAMLLGVEGKAACWQTLRGLADHDERLSTAHLDALLERAARQIADLKTLRTTTAARTLRSRAPAQR